MIGSACPGSRARSTTASTARSSPPSQQERSSLYDRRRSCPDGCLRFGAAGHTYCGGRSGGHPSSCNGRTTFCEDDTMADDDFLIQNPAKPRRRWLPRLGGSGWRRMLNWSAGIVLFVAVVYCSVGAFIVHEIDDDPSCGPGDVATGASRSIAMAAALIDREVNQHEWPANDPWFLPGAILDNMPNYQIGIITALRRFAQEMTDQVSRVRGLTVSDNDLEAARSALNF